MNASNVPPALDVQDALMRLATALAIGVLIGAERHWRERTAPAGSRVAGIRTFGLSGLLGGVIALLGTQMQLGVSAAILTGLALLAFTAVLIAYGMREAAVEASHSATTAIAAITTFALGAMAASGAQAAAVAGAVAAAALLASRETLHGFVRNLELREFQAALVVLVMTFSILPVVPDRAIDPWGGVNPRELWILAILTAVISFAGYIGVKYFGGRGGLLIAGAAGGLSSSTAVLLAFARQARTASNQRVNKQFAAGCLLAGAASALRVGLIAIGLAPQLSLLVGAPLVVLIAAFCLSAWMLTRERGAAGQTASTPPSALLQNPFDLLEILRFVALLAVVFLFVRVMAHYAGPAGAIVTAGITGAVDVHAVAAAIPALIHAGLAPGVAAWAILLGLLTSNLTKMALATIGGDSFGKTFALHSALGLLAAGFCAAAAAIYAPI